MILRYERDEDKVDISTWMYFVFDLINFISCYLKCAFVFSFSLPFLSYFFFYLMFFLENVVYK